jgi:predicted transposase/invertase (TIGR01784 family)
MKDMDSFTKINKRAEVDSADADRRAKIKEKLKAANLSDDRLFSLVMQDPSFCKLVLEIIFDKEFTELRYTGVQKSILGMPGYKSVRLDVFATDKNGEIYNIEMQKLKNDSMPKRSRFYQSVLDVSSLYQGKDSGYENLPNSYVIFITEFDVFGFKRYKYTFKNRCMEIPTLSLNDGTTKIFLNTKGSEQADTPDLLVNFLKYVSDSTSENAKYDDRLYDLHKALMNLKQDKEMEDEYMKTDWMVEEAKEESRREIVENMIQLYRSDGKSDDEIADDLAKILKISAEEAKAYLA